MSKKKTRKLKTKRDVSQEAKKTGPRKLVIGVFFVLIVIQVVLANSLVSRGREITQLTEGREEVLAEIVSLENGLAQASSLAAIRRGAKEMGMRPGKVEFLQPPPLASAFGGVKVMP